MRTKTTFEKGDERAREAPLKHGLYAQELTSKGKELYLEARKRLLEGDRETLRAYLADSAAMRLALLRQAYDYLSRVEPYWIEDGQVQAQPVLRSIQTVHEGARRDLLALAQLAGPEISEVQRALEATAKALDETDRKAANE